MKTKRALAVLLVLSGFSVSALAEGIDGIWASEAKRAYDNKSYKIYEINLHRDNVCTIKQASINIDDALITTVLEDCVADMATNTLSYRVALAKMENVKGIRKDYEYNRPSTDKKKYSAKFEVTGNQLIIGKEKFYKQ